MKARKIIGKRIARVYQNRFWNTNDHTWCIDLVALEFDDGSIMQFSPFDTEDQPGISGIYPAKRPRDSHMETNIITPPLAEKDAS